jgi:hypothetical protein
MVVKMMVRSTETPFAIVTLFLVMAVRLYAKRATSSIWRLEKFI